MQTNKEQDNDWFRLESNKEGTRWFGKCWFVHELLKYEFEVEFDVSVMCTRLFVLDYANKQYYFSDNKFDVVINHSSQYTLQC